MTETVTCKSCGEQSDPLAIFPGTVCLDCWEISQRDAPLPTAQELARMWGGK
jgi:hypothetical protein